MNNHYMNSMAAEIKGLLVTGGGEGKGGTRLDRKGECEKVEDKYKKNSGS